MQLNSLATKIMYKWLALITILATTEHGITAPPEPPVIIAPDNTEIYRIDPTFIILASPDATDAAYYTIEITDLTTSEKYTINSFDTLGSVDPYGIVTYTVSGLNLNLGAYSYTITAWNNDGGTTSPDYYFSTYNLSSEAAWPNQVALQDPIQQFIFTSDPHATDYRIHIWGWGELNIDYTPTSTDTYCVIDIDISGLPFGYYNWEVYAIRDGNWGSPANSGSFEYTPEPITLYEPVDYSTITTTKPFFSFSSGDNTTFTLELWDLDGLGYYTSFDFTFDDYIAAGNGFLFPSSLTPEHLYGWTVYGDQASAVTASYFTVTSPPPITDTPTAIEPVGTIYTSNPTFRFTTVPNATHYALECYDFVVNDFVNGGYYTLEEIDPDLDGIAELPSPTTLNNGTYSWSIIPFDEWENSLPCMTTTYFQINPEAPLPISPIGTISTANPLFQFTTVPEATFYYYTCFNTDNGTWFDGTFTVSEIDPDGNGTAEIPCPFPLANGNYYWDVNLLYTSLPSMATTYFTVDLPAITDTPTAIEPIGTITTSTPTFKFTTVANATYYSYECYELTYGNPMFSGALTPYELDPDGDGIAEIPSPVSLGTGDHLWAVYPYNDNMSGPLMGDTYFTVVLPITDTPAAIEPIGTITTSTPTFKFTTVANATYYNYECYELTTGTVDFSGTLTPYDLDPDGDGIAEIPSPVSLNNGDHYWAIFPFNNNMGGPAMSDTHFTVSIPSIIYPANGTLANEPNPLCQIHSLPDGIYDIIIDGNTTTINMEPADSNGDHFFQLNRLSPGEHTITFVSHPTQASATSTFSVPDTTITDSTAIEPIGTIYDSNPTFRFTTVPNATHYQFDVVCSGYDFHTILTTYEVDPDNDGIGEIPSPVSLYYQTDYIWVIVPFNDYEYGISYENYFTVYNPNMLVTDAPTTIGPVNTINTKHPWFSLMAVPNATSYTIELFHDYGTRIHSFTFSNADTDSNGIVETWPDYNLLNGNYFWKIYAANDFSTGPTTTTYFSVDTHITEKPVAIYPIGTIDNPYATLKFTLVPKAAYYMYYCYATTNTLNDGRFDTANFMFKGTKTPAELDPDSDGIAEIPCTTYWADNDWRYVTLPTHLTNNTYHWYVVTYNDAEWGPPMDKTFFTVAADPNPNINEHIAETIQRLFPNITPTFTDTWEANGQYWGIITNNTDTIFLWASTTKNPTLTPLANRNNSLNQASLNAWVLPRSTTNNGTITTWTYSTKPAASLTSVTPSPVGVNCDNIATFSLTWTSTGTNVLLTLPNAETYLLPPNTSTNINTAFANGTWSLKALGIPYSTTATWTTNLLLLPICKPIITNIFLSSSTIGSMSFTTNTTAVQIRCQATLANLLPNTPLVVTRNGSNFLTQLTSPNLDTTINCSNIGTYQFNVTDYSVTNPCGATWSQSLVITQAPSPRIADAGNQTVNNTTKTGFGPQVWTITGAGTLTAGIWTRPSGSTSESDTTWASNAPAILLTSDSGTLTLTNTAAETCVRAYTTIPGQLPSTIETAHSFNYVSNPTFTWISTPITNQTFNNNAQLRITYPFANSTTLSETIIAIADTPINGRTNIVLTNGVAVLTIDGNNRTTCWTNNFRIATLPNHWTRAANGTLSGQTTTNNGVSSLQAQFVVQMPPLATANANLSNNNISVTIDSYTTNTALTLWGVTATTGTPVTNNYYSACGAATITGNRKQTLFATGTRPNFLPAVCPPILPSAVGDLNVNVCEGTISIQPLPNLTQVSMDGTPIWASGQIAPVAVVVTNGTHTFTATGPASESRINQLTLSGVGGLQATWTINDGNGVQVATNSGTFRSTTTGNIVFGITSPAPGANILVTGLPSGATYNSTTKAITLNTAGYSGNLRIPINIILTGTGAWAGCPGIAFEHNLVLLRTTGLLADIPPSDPFYVQCMQMDPDGNPLPWDIFQWP